MCENFMGKALSNFIWENFLISPRTEQDPARPTRTNGERTNTCRKGNTKW